MDLTLINTRIQLLSIAGGDLAKAQAAESWIFGGQNVEAPGEPQTAVKTKPEPKKETPAKTAEKPSADPQPSEEPSPSADTTENTESDTAAGSADVPDRGEIKALGMKFTQALGSAGNEKLKAFYAEIGVTKFSEVPDDKLADLKAMMDGEIAMA